MDIRRVSPNYFFGNIVQFHARKDYGLTLRFDPIFLPKPSERKGRIFYFVCIRICYAVCWIIVKCFNISFLYPVECSSIFRASKWILDQT